MLEKGPQEFKDITKESKESSEDEMVVVFLQAEMDSDRFGTKLLKAIEMYGTSREIIDNPNLEDEKENELRKKIFAEYRHYGKNFDLFENFPEHVKWEWISLSQDDMGKIRYINDDYWINLSNGSRLAVDAVENIKKGNDIFGQRNERFLEAAKSLSEDKQFPPMILVSDQKGGDIVVLEGHLRLTAYMLEPRNIPKKVNAIIGYSPDFKKWGLF